MSRAPRRAAAAVRDAGRAAGLPPAGRDPWIWIGGGWLALTLLAYLYLGARPGGRGPIRVYHEGRAMLALGAAGSLALGAAWCAWRRPFRQGRRLRGLAGLALAIGLAQWPLPYPTSREDRPSSVAFRLPVEGEWRTVHGGEGREANLYSVLTHDRRYALVLVREANGSTRRPEASGASFRPRDFLAWGEPVLAPAAGQVVAVRDGLADADSPAGRAGDPPFGNRVVIEVAPGEYVFLCHLAAGTIAVRAGARVVAGQTVGRVGFSGRPGLTREPHVALHLATSAEDGWGEAIPWSFVDYQTGGRAIERGVPRGGLRAGRPAGELVRSTAPRAGG